MESSRSTPLALDKNKLWVGKTSGSSEATNDTNVTLQYKLRHIFL